VTERLEIAKPSREAILRQAKLTPKEQEVVSHLLRGEENKVIAEALGMSWRTVQKHLERIYQKLGVPTRAKAIVLLTGTGHSAAVRNAGRKRNKG
jgi:DNA-binding NarL/FixJ family response regulator